MAQEDAGPSMTPQAAKQIARLESLLRNAQSLLKDLGSWSHSASGELTDAEVKTFRKLDSDLGAGLEQLARPLARAKAVLQTQSVDFRFNDDQRTALGRLAKGEEVLWMQSGAAFESLSKRGLVRVGHDAKSRVIAVLTDLGKSVIADWPESRAAPSPGSTSSLPKP